MGVHMVGGMGAVSGGAALCLHPDRSPLRHLPLSSLRHTLGSQNTDALFVVSLTKF